MCIFPPTSSSSSFTLPRWVKHISDAADAFKIRAKNSEPAPDTETASAAASSAPSALASQPAVPRHLLSAVDNEKSGGGSSLRSPSTASTISAMSSGNAVAGGSGTALSAGANSAAGDSAEATAAAAAAAKSSDGDAMAASAACAFDASDNGTAETNHSQHRRVADSDAAAAAAAAAAATDDETATEATAGRRDRTTSASENSVNLRIREYATNANDTRTLTTAPLVAPSEVLVSVSPSLMAEPVLTPTGKAQIKHFENARHEH